MTRKQKHLLIRIIAAAVLFLAGSLLHLPEQVEMGIFLACYVIIGWDIVWKAITNILSGQVFDENFLMTIATIGALILGEHSEGVAVMLFYQVGEWFQSYAVSKSRKSIASLMDIRPDYANVERDGKLVQVDPEEVSIGNHRNRVFLCGHPVADAHAGFIEPDGNGIAAKIKTFPGSTVLIFQKLRHFLRRFALLVLGVNAAPAVIPSAPCA